MKNNQYRRDMFNGLVHDPIPHHVLHTISSDEDIHANRCLNGIQQLTFDDHDSVNISYFRENLNLEDLRPSTTSLGVMDK